MLVAAGILHAPGKAHAGTNRRNQTGISHTLGKSIKRSHRLAGNAAHQNTSGNQYHSGFMSFQQKINYTDNNECTYYQKHLHSLHKIIFCINIICDRTAFEKCIINCIHNTCFLQLSLYSKSTNTVPHFCGTVFFNNFIDATSHNNE